MIMDAARHALGRLITAFFILVCLGSVSVSGAGASVTPAPRLTVSGQTLTWTQVGPTGQYLFVQKVPGRAWAYSSVNGTSVTPAAVPNTTVRYSVRAYVTGSLWATEVSITYPASPPPPTTPANTAAPSIRGVTLQGALLTASPGLWTGSPTPTMSYQWQQCDSSGRSCLGLSGQTRPTYATVVADVGRTLRAVVTATNTVGATSANSPPTAPISAVSSGALTLTASRITISWPAQAGATDYKGAASTGPRGSTRTSTYQDLGASATSWTPPAQPGQTVYYGVATEGSSETWSTNEVSITWPAGSSSNPYNTVIGLMGPTGWGSTVSSFVLAGGVKWDRVDVSDGGYSSGTLVDSALAYGSSVVMILPANTGQAMSWMNAYRGYGSRIVYEYMNEAYVGTSPATYASGYQAAYNAKHGAGITQPLLFMTTGIGYSGSQMWLEACKSAVPSLQVDAFSSHPYGAANQDTNSNHVNGVNALIAQHQDAVSAGFGNTPFYVTEFGFSIDPSGPDANGANSNGAYAPSYAGQAAVLTGAYQQMMTLPWLKMIMYYNAHDDSSGWWGVLTTPGATGHDYAGEAAGPGANGGPPTPVIARPAWYALLSFLPSNGAG